MEHEIAKLRNELKLNSDKFTKTTSGASRLRNELSVNTAECLIADEENAELTHKLEHLYRRKSDLVTQLIRMQITSESIDSKIQTVIDNMEMKFEVDM